MRTIAFVLASLLLSVVLTATVAAQITPPTHLHGNYFSGKVFLNWEPPSSDIHAASYHVYRTDNGGSTFALLGSIHASFFPIYVDSSVVPKGDYHYFVTASGTFPPDSTESGPSDTIDVRTIFHPAPPQDLSGWVDSAGAELRWQRPENHDSILYYNVYRWAMGDTTPHVIGSTPLQRYTDGTFNPAQRSLFSVTAVYLQDSAESFPAEPVVLPHLQSAIQFTSTPPKTAQAGHLFLYQAITVTNPPGHKVCYSLEDSPQGMTIDSTGLVSWTPAQGGFVEVQIHASICDSGSGEGEQEFSLMVLNGPPSSITGTVRNQHGDGVPNTRLKLFDVQDGDFVLRTYSDSSGHYLFPVVNPSTYYLRIVPDSGSGYSRQWYNGAFRLADATPIQVPDSTQVVVDITLAPLPPPPPLFVISGSVLDDSSHSLGGSVVEAFPARQDSTPWHIDGDNEDGDHGGGDHGDCDPVRSAYADSNGHFALTLPAGNYILSARHRGFYPQFYDHKATPLEATVIALTGNDSGLTFNLHPHLHGSGIIAGSILNRADSSRVRSFVAGFHKPAADSGFDGFVAFARTDSSGNYALTGLPDGYFIVLAMPRGDFIPTFYSLTGGTPFHDSASAVAIAGGDSVGGISIYVTPDTADGLNSISGIVQSQDGGRITPSTLSPVVGAIVTVTNRNTGKAVGTGITDAGGSYTVTGLAPSNYLVTFQKPGSTTTSASVSLAYSNNAPASATVNAQMSPSSGGTLGFGVMSVGQRWNLVSLPVQVTSTLLSDVFPTAVSAAFRYTPAGYNASASLDYASGYWLRFQNAETFTLNGAARTTQTIPITAGWNLIGSLSSPVASASATTTPSGILASEFFGFNNGYTIASTIQPGQGYWVKAAADGSLTLTASPSTTKSSAPAISSLSAFSAITIRDENGGSQTLYVGPADGRLSTARYAMPPLPPGDAFDARFASQKLVESFDPALRVPARFPVSVRTGSASLTLQWSVNDPNRRYTLMDAKGSVIARLTGTGTATFSSTRSPVLQIEGGSLPKTFSLSQNYPNPFNPTTSIGFSLPAPAAVSLTIYNILGQEVAAPLNGARYDAGSYAVTVDGSTLSSGIYFYRLQAGSFSAVRKMVLLK